MAGTPTYRVTVKSFKRTKSEINNSIFFGAGEEVEVIDIYLKNPEKMISRGLNVTRCDYDYVPKCYCLDFR